MDVLGLLFLQAFPAEKLMQILSDVLLGKEGSFFPGSCIFVSILCLVWLNLSKNLVKLQQLSHYCKQRGTKQTIGDPPKKQWGSLIFLQVRTNIAEPGFLI